MLVQKRDTGIPRLFPMLFVSFIEDFNEKEGFFYAQPVSLAAHTARAANRRFEKELLSFLLYAFCIPYL